MSSPMQILECWLDEAANAGGPATTAMTLATVGDAGHPSARVVSLKRLEPEGLVFTTALWTRKAAELRVNPRVALVFHWAAPGRQVRIEGRAEVAERELAEELFAERPRSHQLQALVSHQGETIEAIGPLRTRLDALKAEMGEGPIPCPEDWGAVRVRPDVVELWSEAADRLHERRLFERHGTEWTVALLSP